MNHLEKAGVLAAPTHIPTTIVHDLHQALRQQPHAQTHWHQLSAQDQQLVYHWIADAPSIRLWPLRIRNVVELLRGPLPVALRQLGVLTLHELCALYGHPRPLREYPTATQEQAIGDQRVLQLQAVHAAHGTRIITRIIAPQHEHRGGLVMVFARPCTFTAEIVSWLDHNPWTSEAEVAAVLEQCRQYHADEALLTMEASAVQTYVDALPQEIRDMILGRCIALRTVLLATSLLEAMDQPTIEADDASDAEAQRLILQKIAEQQRQEEQLATLLRQMSLTQQLELKKVVVQQALDGLLSVMKGTDAHWWVVEATRAWLANPTDEVAQQAMRAAQFDRTPGGADYYALRYHLHPIAVLEAQDALAAARQAQQAVKRYALWSGKSASVARTAEEHTRSWQIKAAQAVLTMAWPDAPPLREAAVEPGVSRDHPEATTPMCQFCTKQPWSFEGPPVKAIGGIFEDVHEGAYLGVCTICSRYYLVYWVEQQDTIMDYYCPIAPEVFGRLEATRKSGHDEASEVRALIKQNEVFLHAAFAAQWVDGSQVVLQGRPWQ